MPSGPRLLPQYMSSCAVQSRLQHDAFMRSRKLYVHAAPNKQMLSSPRPSAGALPAQLHEQEGGEAGEAGRFGGLRPAPGCCAVVVHLLSRSPLLDAGFKGHSGQHWVLLHRLVN